MFFFSTTDGKVFAKSKEHAMQRTVYNVWGRELKNHEEANARAAKALADNPKIQNLHIAIITRTHYFTHTRIPEPLTREVVYYQARWYDRKVAIKEGKARRLQDANIEPHVCNCEYCER